MHVGHFPHFTDGKTMVRAGQGLLAGQRGREDLGFPGGWVSLPQTHTSDSPPFLPPHLSPWGLVGVLGAESGHEWLMSEIQGSGEQIHSRCFTNVLQINQ